MTAMLGLFLLTGSLGLPLGASLDDALASTSDDLVTDLGPIETFDESSSVSLPAATPAWAPAETATIHPGVTMVTNGASCTANFVYYDASDVYLGYAAHCAATGASTNTNGCDPANEPLDLGTPVTIAGASQPGTLAYTSWGAMQAAGETGSDACDFNDFAVVRIAAADTANVNPSVPSFGGPTGVGPGPGFGESVYSYQNSALRFGLTPLSPKEGVSLGTSASGWSIQTYTATPGIPGDSGSGLLDSEGRAVGVLSTVAILPLTGSNNYAGLQNALAYAASHGFSVTLAEGTEPFVGGLIL
jgi:hypothetical protein